MRVDVGFFIGFNMEDRTGYERLTHFADYRVVNDGGIGFTEKDLKAPE